jgi:hypothetical protein
MAFKPDWSRHKNGAPFKRSDGTLDPLPISVVAFPGVGIVENLADKARKMGISVWRRRKACWWGVVAQCPREIVRGIGKLSADNP